MRPRLAPDPLAPALADVYMHVCMYVCVCACVCFFVQKGVPHTSESKRCGSAIERHSVVISLINVSCGSVYGLATISRLLKMIGLFCKKAL